MQEEMKIDKKSDEKTLFHASDSESVTGGGGREEEVDFDAFANKGKER